jgi:hypothetical protein
VRPVPKFGNDTMPSAPSRLISRSTRSVRCVAWIAIDSTTTSKRLAGEDVEAGLDVLLDHVDAAARAREHLRVVDLDAVAGAALGALQVVEQRAVAAAEVEHARRRARSSRRSPRGRGAGRCAGAADRSRAAPPLRGRRGRARSRGRRPAVAPPPPTRRALRASPTARRDPVEVGAHQRVVARVVEQERVVAVRRVDLGVGDARRLASSAATISRLRSGAKRQSVVNDATRNRSAPGASAAARSPPWARAPDRSSRARG